MEYSLINQALLEPYPVEAVLILILMEYSLIYYFQ